MRIYFGPYQWRERISSKTGLPSPPGVFGWRMPTGATQAIDCGGDIGVGTPNAFSVARTLFLCPDSVILGNPYTQIASDPLEVLTAPRRNSLKNVFNATTLASTRLVDVLHELVCGQTDLTRLIHCPPRIAGRNGEIPWLMNGVIVKSTPVGIGTPEWAGLVARHQAQYRAAASNGISRLESKLLATLAKKYALTNTQAVEQFIPADMPKLDPIEPTTTLNESFPGTAATLGGDNTWVEHSGTWENVSGKGQATPGGANIYAYCDATLSTDDMRVGCNLESTDGTGYPYRGPTLRNSTSAVTCYSSGSAPEVDDYYAQRVTAGAGTDIIVSELTATRSFPVFDELSMNGDAIELFSATVSRGSTTDTNISGNLRAGIQGYRNAGVLQFDAWTVSDLAVGVTRPPVPTLTRQAVTHSFSY